MNIQILLVEDDASLRGGLTELLTREGYAVVAAACAREAQAKMKQGGLAMALLDVALPDGDGVTLCRQWREEGVTLPILFLTARDEEYDVVRGLDAGGNDYVTKPFRMQELLSRIRALLRGAQGNLSRGALEIDQTRMQVRQNGEVLPLTLTEYKVLVTLMQKGGVATRDQLLGVLWDDGAKFVDDNTLSVHISRLREKIAGTHIRTVRGVGYQWED